MSDYSWGGLGSVCWTQIDDGSNDYSSSLMKSPSEPPRSSSSNSTGVGYDTLVNSRSRSEFLNEHPDLRIIFVSIMCNDNMTKWDANKG